MITLLANEKLTLETSSTSSIIYRFTYSVVQPVEINGTISTIGSNVIFFTKSNKMIQENIVYFTIINNGGSDNTITLYKTLGNGTNVILYKTTLSAGDLVIFNAGDWKVYNSIGELKTTGSGGSSPTPSTPNFEWITVTSNTLAEENKGYITNSLGRIEIMLNSTNSGTLTGVTGKDTGGWRIMIPPSKILRFDEIVIDNYLESTLPTDSVTIVYLGDDVYQVINSIGNLTYNIIPPPLP